MNSVPIFEREALDAVERRLIEDGYRFIREPERDKLPDFMRSFRPDAIAVGKEPNLVIEVISRHPDTKVMATKLKQLQSLLEGRGDWKLEVVYAGTPGVLPAPASLSAIRSRYEEIKALSRTDPRGGLILLLTVLEAVARLALPERAAKPLTPATTVEVLASLGYIVQSEAETLRAAGKLRNLLVHGDLSAAIPAGLLGAVVEIVDALLRHLERKGLTAS